MKLRDQDDVKDAVLVPENVSELLELISELATIADLGDAALGFIRKDHGMLVVLKVKTTPKEAKTPDDAVVDKNMSLLAMIDVSSFNLPAAQERLSDYIYRAFEALKVKP